MATIKDLKEKYADLLFPTEKSVQKMMIENKIKKIRLYITAYVNDSDKQDYGWSVNNINSDYNFKQKSISRKTQTFIIKSV